VTALARHAGRTCSVMLNSLHSTIYFSPDFDKALADHGFDDPMACYVAGRAAALGPVGPGPVSAAFYSFSHAMLASHLPRIWTLADPGRVQELRRAAADAILRRCLGADAVGAPEMAEAAELALRAAEAGLRPGRALYAAHADLPVPEEPHLALWHAATLLREHRGDGHLALLAEAELYGLDALVLDCSREGGLTKDMVMLKRGWTEDDWAAAQARLRDRDLLDGDGRLTEEGAQFRDDLEEETDRLDLAPYEHLGPAGTARLTDLATRFTGAAAAGGAFPAPLLAMFAADSDG
jgi:hypothetical protein